MAAEILTDRNGNPRPWINEIDIPNVGVMGWEGARNLEGRREGFNKNGEHVIDLAIDNELGRAMEAQGWRIVWTKPSEKFPMPQAHIRAKADYRFHDDRDPKVFLVEGNTIIAQLFEQDLGQLDRAPIARMDIRLHPFTSLDDDGVWRATAFIKELYVELNMSSFNRQYGTSAYLNGNRTV